MNKFEKIDYTEEVNSLIPNELSDETYKSFCNFDREISKNIHKSIFVNHLKTMLGESWTIFIFLNIINSFKKTIPINSSDISKFEENIQLIIPESYINSQIIYWKNVYMFQNFMIIMNKGLSPILIVKIALLVQIAIKILIDLKIINEKINYVKTKKNIGEGHYNKIIYNYKLLINVKTNTCFNVEQKFHRSPLKIIDYKFPIKKKIKKSENETITIVEWKEKTLITGPTYIRSEVYDKTNPYNTEVFKIKNMKLRENYLQTKFYPDIPFINHLKLSFYSNLSLETILNEIKKTKKELEKTFNIQNWDKEIIDKRIFLQKKYAKLLEDQKTYIFLNHDWGDHYYFPSNNDYRGRKYYCSPLTFTHFKLSRFCFHYGYEGKLESSFFKWPNLNAIETVRKNLIESNNETNEIIGFYLIGMGKLDDIRKNQIETPLEVILNKGKDMYIEKNNILYEKIKENWLDIHLKDKIDVIELECYRFGLKNFLNKDKTKRIIIKDATASGYQIQAYLIGVSDEDKLKWINMGKENIFIDTYLCIIKCFENELKNKEIPLWAKGYFKRSIIKKFCMIIPYSAGFEECFSHIKNFIKIEDMENAIKLFFTFYKFIKKDLWKYLGYKEPYANFIKKILENNTEYNVKSETAETSLKYNKAQNKEYDTHYLNQNNEKIRTSRVFFAITNQIDKKKTLTAFAPNLIHFHDSDIIRILHLDPYNLNFASIHDAFIISSFDCGKLTYYYGNIFKIKMRFKHESPITCLL